MEKERFSHLAKMLKKYRYIAVAIAVGFLLLVLPGGGGDKQQTEKKTHENFDVNAFENKVERALSDCNGVGRCRVVLSMEAGVERVYEKDLKKSMRENENGAVLQNDSDAKPSMISEGSGRENALLVKEIYPEFRGAVVVCDGADRADVKSAVGAVVSSLTGLRSDKISIIKMKK